MTLKIELRSNGYVITNISNSGRYIADALHIEADRESLSRRFQYDEEAQQTAAREGFSLIYGMEDVPDGVYMDTPHNREVIRQMMMYFPGYRFLHRYRAQHPDA